MTIDKIMLNSDDPFHQSPFKDTAYSQLPLHGPHDAGVGHALITLVEPHLGREEQFNRWYEDNHFFDGALQMPWMFAGRRWVATHDLQQLRYPADSPVAKPVTAGAFLGTYWITGGRLEDHYQWMSATNARHRAVGNQYPQRTNVYTAFHDTAGTVYRDADVPRARFSLMDPAAGLVLQVIDAPSSESREQLERWLLGHYLSSRVVPGSPISSAMVFRPNAPRVWGHSTQRYAELGEVANDGRRLTLLWFLTEDPRDVWYEHFAREQENIAAGCHGVTAFVAPFIAMKMGTSTYVDQLRGPAREQ